MALADRKEREKEQRRRDIINAAEKLFFAIVLHGARILNAVYTDCSKLDITGIEKIKAMGQGFYEFTKNYPDYFRMLCYSGSERSSNADNDDAKEILELTHDNIGLISRAFKVGIEDGTVRSDLDPLEMAVYLCVSRLSVLNLDPQWKMALAAGGISYDRLLKDFRCFISPSIVICRKADGDSEEGHD